MNTVNQPTADFALEGEQPPAGVTSIGVGSGALLGSDSMTSKLQQIIDMHSALLADNPYCYFELAYTRTTEWMVWLCTDARENNPARKILAKGQGSTPEEAADAAIESYCSALPNVQAHLPATAGKETA